MRAKADEPGFGPESFWTPPRLVKSAWLGHAPFAFHLMKLLQPRTLVELGTHNGFSLYTFAEAAYRLGIPTHLYAVDTWEGDDHAGRYGEEVLEDVRAIVDSDYAESVTLVRSYFADAVDRFEDGSVDLLHIDGRHGYEDVAEDFELYRPKVSSRGVVLFHDIRAYKPGFGVHRFWDEVRETAPSFEFEHSFGLGLLAIGLDVPEAVIDFLRIAAEDPEGIRARYARQGDWIKDAFWSAHDAAADLRIAEDRARDLEADRDAALEAAAAAEAEAAAARAETEAYLSSTSWRVTAPLRRLARRRS